ncbi:conserved protein, unknown function [Hepatocystis sp. ex Piliocolobus tephrosceles]|nr:conserved protein, unknown function [Hepatocystis sp. ex Piliocolobus tephrosceles]
MDFLGEDTKIERNLEYLLNLILNQITGLDLLDTHKTEQIKINRIIHRLSHYLIYCMDTGFMSHKFNITDLVKCSMKISKDKQMDIENILNFFLHLREKDYTQNYNTECLSLLKIKDNTDIEFFNLLNNRKYIFNDFFLFYLHQTGYMNYYCQYKDDVNYKKIIAYILKYGNNMKIKKKICKNLFIFSSDYKNRYHPLVNSIVFFLQNHSDHLNLSLFILNTLINITNNNKEIKNELIKLNISKIANFFLLSNNYEIINKIVLLYINLSKESYMCDDIVNMGLVVHLIDILFNIYFIDLKIKKEICINILCIIGHILNSVKYYKYILNHFIGLVEVAIYIYQTTDIIYFNKIKLIFFFKQIGKYSYTIKEKICKHLFPLIIKEIYLVVDNDFIFSVLILLNVICEYRTNCLLLSQINIQAMFDFIKSLNIVDLYNKVIFIEGKLKQCLDVVSR